MPKKRLKTFRRTFTYDGKTIDRMFVSKKDADEWYEAMRRRADRVKAGMPITMDDAPMMRVAALWLQLRSKTSDYWKDDERKMTKALVPALGDKSIRTITKADCENALHGYRLENRLSGATFNRYRACLHTFFEYVLEEGYRETNPVTKIELMKEHQRGILVSDEDIENYLAAAEKEKAAWFFPFMVLAMNTGCRTGELLGFFISDYLPELGFIKITRRFQVSLNRLKEGTKGGGGRIVPLNGFVIETLDNYLSGCPHDAAITPLFHDSDGTRASAHTLNDIHVRVRTAAGLSEGVRLYDITRHKFGSMVAMQTGNMRLVQKVLGHSTAQISERYSHSSEEFLGLAGTVIVGARGKREGGEKG